MTSTSESTTRPARPAPESRAGALFRSFLRRPAHPLLLAAVVVCATAALTFSWDRGTVTFLFLLGTIGWLAAFERIIPFAPQWHPSGLIVVAQGQFLHANVDA